MKRNDVTTGIVFAIALSLCGAVRADGQELADAARKMEALRHKALAAADIGALTDLFAADMTYTHSNGLVQTREQLFEMLERGDIKYLSFAASNSAYRTYPGTVVVTGRQTIEMSISDKPVTSDSRFTAVYVEGAGGHEGLCLVAYQSTSLPKMIKQEQR